MFCFVFAFCYFEFMVWITFYILNSLSKKILLIYCRYSYWHICKNMWLTLCEFRASHLMMWTCLNRLDKILEYNPLFYIHCNKKKLPSFFFNLFLSCIFVSVSFFPLFFIRKCHMGNFFVHTNENRLFLHINRKMNVCCFANCCWMFDCLLMYKCGCTFATAECMQCRFNAKNPHCMLLLNHRTVWIYIYLASVSFFF